MSQPDPKRHSAMDDAQGIVFGAAMCAFGLVILQGLGLVTGQTAGLAIVISYATGWSFGAVFFAINLPFYWLALRRMGLRFTLKTFAAVSLLSVLSGWLAGQVTLDWSHPLLGSVLFGMITASGLLALFRHGASLGGVGVLAVYLQDRIGFRAGWTQLLVDAVVFGLALFVLPPASVAWSLAGAVVMNLIIAINHRRDRYVAM
ncbi:YitT family protein [Halovulum dunhuangense]|uniref:YitT family protein n=1 Tax=Halovulum dunhuangense TaxID=1505036 RepID=A0A849L2W1_9RHOB|nr:YitT family protein [Halovulum dunhuangense]NNU80593.1 YitT family protein [Halovulum dunhuangense]